MRLKICPYCRTSYGPDVDRCPTDGAVLSDAEAVADRLIGTVLADRYRVQRLLGEGGMGRVYLAEHVRMGRASAVKIIHPELAPTPDAVARFTREAANASRINHPNVAAIYDFGESAEGTLYLAMEYVAGGTLTDLLLRDGAFAPPRAAELTRQIADALHAAHSLGIVHRDLKPDNVLVAPGADGNEIVKVVDFGIAKATRSAGQTLTSTGMSIGTPAFMSPEQLAGEVVDAGSDVYSLGLVLFMMLTNTLPFPEVTSKQSLVNRLTQRPRSLAEAAPQMAWPDALQRAIDTALSPEPADRHADAPAFARDVIAAVRAPSDVKTRAMTPLVTRVVAEPPAARASRGRNPALAAAAVVVLVGASAAAFMRRETAPSASAPPASGAIAITKSAIPAYDSVAPRVGVGQESVAVGAERTSATVRTTPSTTARATPSVIRSSAARDSRARIATRPAPTEATPPVDVPLAENPQAPRTAAVSETPESLRARPSRFEREAPTAQVIMLHLVGAREHATAGRLGEARTDLRVATQLFRTFAREHPGTEETRVLRGRVLGVTQDALRSCETASANGAVSPAECERLGGALRLLTNDGGMPRGGFNARRQGMGGPPAR